MPKKAGAGCPFIVAVDYNEYLPNHLGYRFEQVVPRPKTMTVDMNVGDYSIVGHPGVLVERKTLGDLYGSFGKNKRENMIERISIMNETAEYAAMMVEAEYYDVVNAPPRHSKLHPRSLSGTIIALQQRFPNVHWCFMRDRECAEMMTFRILERFYNDKMNASQHDAIRPASEPPEPGHPDGPAVPRRPDGGH